MWGECRLSITGVLLALCRAATSSAFSKSNPTLDVPDVNRLRNQQISTEGTGREKSLGSREFCTCKLLKTKGRIFQISIIAHVHGGHGDAQGSPLISVD